MKHNRVSIQEAWNGCKVCKGAIEMTYPKECTCEHTRMCAYHLRIILGEIRRQDGKVS
jgi:hypothetical protein